MKKGFVAILVILFSVSLIGCATWPPQKKSAQEPKVKAPLVVAEDLKFDDVPSPNGFKLAPKESFVFKNDYTRVGLLKYAGRPTAAEVIGFYRRNMPLYGWELVNVVEYKKTIMNYEKGDETAIVTIEPTQFSTHINIAVAPKMKKEKK